MPLTNYPQGLSSFGFPLIGAGPYLTAGQVFFVNSATGVDNPAHGTSPSDPFATIAYALTRCSAGRGDFIFALPGHAESVLVASGITAVAGVSVVGLGTGVGRPTITLGGVVGATITVAAAQFSLINLRIKATALDSITAGITVTAADFLMRDCRYDVGDGTNQAVLGVSLGTGADGAVFERCRFLSPTSGSTAAIQTAVAIDSLQVRDCYFLGDFTACIRNITVACTNMFIDRNHFYCLGSAKSIIVDASATGIIRDNTTFITANIAAGGSITAAGAYKSNNYAQEAAGVASSAVIDPTTAAIT